MHALTTDRWHQCQSPILHLSHAPYYPPTVLAELLDLLNRQRVSSDAPEANMAIQRGCCSLLAGYPRPLSAPPCEGLNLLGESTCRRSWHANCQPLHFLVEARAVDWDVYDDTGWMDWRDLEPCMYW